MLRIAIRTDAGPNIGFGHAMRCITLGAALVSHGHHVTVLSREPLASLADRASTRGMTTTALHHNEDDIDELASLSVDGIIVDGYHLIDTAQRLSEAGQSWIAIDDNRELPVAGAAGVLNHNVFADSDLYPEIAADRTWTGPSYALLREDVTALEPASEQRALPSTVLLSLGGADPLGLSAPLAKLLSQVPGAAIRVASNQARAGHDELQALVQSSGAIAFATPDLIDTFARSEIAVIGAGTTLWETAYLGLPTIALITADNQHEVAHSAGAAGIAKVIDARTQTTGFIAEQFESLRSDQHQREQMMHRGRELFDGQGAERAARAIARALRD